MFTTGMDTNTRAYFNASTSIIAIPTRYKNIQLIKQYIWQVIHKKDIILILYIKTFILLFIIGGITGIIISNAVLDIIYHDTYFIIGNFHTILSIGAVIGIKIGIERYNRNVIGLERNTLLSLIEFYTFLIGVLLTFYPHHILGIEGMPRRYKDYPKMYKE